MIVPGSSAVKRQAEAEGLDRVFKAAGFEWHESACSLCAGVNADFVAPHDMLLELRGDNQPPSSRLSPTWPGCGCWAGCPAT